MAFTWIAGMMMPSQEYIGIDLSEGNFIGRALLNQSMGTKYFETGGTWRQSKHVESATPTHANHLWVIYGSTGNI